MEELKQQHTDLSTKIEEQLTRLQVRRAEWADTVPLSGVTRTTPDAKLVMKKRRTLEDNPTAKISGLCWASDSRHVATSSQMGKILVWNAFQGSKELLITPNIETWYMFCEFSPDDTLLAAGGLDNTCTIFKLNGLSDDPDCGAKVEAVCSLEKHMGYVGDAKWTSKTNIMTCSGDRTMVLWDVETKKDLVTYKGHTADVHAMDLIDANTWVTCSADKTAKLWDSRLGGTGVVATFVGHEMDINSIKMFPDNQAFGTASEDGTCRLWDTRCLRQMNIYADEDNRSIGATTLEFNHSGSLIFAGNADGSIVAWDVISGEFVEPELMGHQEQLTRLVRSPDGRAMCSTACSNTVFVWA